MRRDDTKLSPLASTDLFHPQTGTCHVTVLWLCGCFSFVWVVLSVWVCFGVVFAFCSLCFGFCSRKRDKGFGLCIGPLQFTFAATTGPCVNLLINLICNMLGNMLFDLAEAIRRWTEKNCGCHIY